jgi:Tol biopolymer transport system component
MEDLTTPLAATLLASLVLLASCTSGTPGPVATPDRRVAEPLVVFQATGPTHQLVATARLDGSDLAFPLEDLPGGDQTNPDWSPDGSHIVLAVSDGARDDLWVAGADGSDPQLLLDCAGACVLLDDPAWSPDGRSVVYSRTAVRGRTSVGTLETVDVATGEVSVWLRPRPRTFTAGARWSPDGSAVVYESIHTTDRTHHAEVDSVVLRVLEVGSHRPGPPRTSPDRYAATADWSPDGSRIAYVALATPGATATDLFVMPAERGSPRQVTFLADDGGYAAEPTWRDDDVIVFSGRRDAGFGGAGALLRVDTARGSVAEVGTRQLVGRHPRVRPGS